MGLELKVTADDVKSLFTEDRELLMAALRHKDPGTGSKYSPNLYIDPLAVLANFTLKEVAAYLTTRVGFNEGLIGSSVMAAADTSRSLIASLDNGQSSDLDRLNLDRLVQQHVSQLKWFEGLYAQLSGLNAAESPNEVAGSIDRGINGLRMLITRSNMMYDPRTRAEFLQHVHEGMVEKKYEQRLLRGGG